MQEASNTSYWASTLHLLLRPILYSAVEVSVPQQLYASLKKWITSESGGKTEHPFLLIPQPPREREHSSLCTETGRMNASETTQRAFGLPRSQGSPMYLACFHRAVMRFQAAMCPWPHATCCHLQSHHLRQVPPLNIALPLPRTRNLRDELLQQRQSPRPPQLPASFPLNYASPLCYLSNPL